MRTIHYIVLFLCLAPTTTLAGPKTDKLLKDLTSRKEIERFRAAGDLATVEPNKAVIAALIKTFQEDNESVPLAAAISLGRFGSSSTPALLEELRGKRIESKRWAGLALSMMDELSNEALEALASHIDEDSPDFNVPAMDALGRAKGRAIKALPALLKHFRFLSRAFPRQTPHQSAPSVAMTALESIGKADPKAFLHAHSIQKVSSSGPNLDKLIAIEEKKLEAERREFEKLYGKLIEKKDPDSRIRKVFESLELPIPKTFPQSKERAVWLFAALEDERDSVKALCLEELGSLFSKKYFVDYQSKYLKTLDQIIFNNKSLRRSALRLLLDNCRGSFQAAVTLAKYIERDFKVPHFYWTKINDLGGVAATYANALIPSLQSKSKSVRMSAIRAFSTLDRPYPKALIPLSKLLKTSKDPEELHEIIGALDSFGAKAIIALPALLALFEVTKAEEHPYFSLLACLEKFGDKTLPALPRMLKFIEEKPSRVRLLAINIQSMGVKARSALPALARAYVKLDRSIVSVDSKLFAKLFQHLEANEARALIPFMLQDIWTSEQPRRIRPRPKLTMPSDIERKLDDLLAAEEKKLGDGASSKPSKPKRSIKDSKKTALEKLDELLEQEERKLEAASKPAKKD